MKGLTFSKQDNSKRYLAASLDNPVRFRWNRGRTGRTRYGLFRGTTTEG